MDKVTLGRRVAEARELAGMTQDGLGRAVDLDRTAITRLERGDRKLSVPELVAIAEVLRRPLAYFVADPVPAAVSRRQDSAHAHDTSRALDVELDQFAADVRTLSDLGLVIPAERAPTGQTPRSHQRAEAMAATARRRVGMDSEPVQDLGETCEQFGLYVFSASLGQGGPDGGCVEVGDERLGLGAAIINGDTPPGRRRMTLAHELGHWLSGDAYDLEVSPDIERTLNSFAIYFLAPRAGMHRVWSQYPDWVARDRALAVGASFKLSWSAVVGQLRNVDLIDQDTFHQLSRDEPRSGDYLRLRLSWTEELESPYVSPVFTAACLEGYAHGQLTPSRTVEMLRGTLEVRDLPQRLRRTLDDFRRSFSEHDE